MKHSLFYNSICEVTIYFRIYQTTTIIKKEVFINIFYMLLN